MSRLQYRITLIAALVVVTQLTLARASNSKVGTSGAQFLKIGAGARSTAMGDAFVGIADDVNAVYFNPAGLTQLGHPEIMAMHTQWFQGMNYDFGAYAAPTKIGTIGISACTLQTDSIDKRSADEGLQGSFKALDAAYALSYANKLGENLSLGLTGRFIRQEIDSAKASAMTADVGVHEKIVRWPMTVGLAVRHIGPSVKFVDESDPLPLTYDAGVGAHFLRDRMLIGFDIKKPRDNGFKMGVGGEWRQSLRREFRYAVRGGFNNSATDANGASGLSLGAGLGYRSLDLDFAWVPFGDLGNTFRYAARFFFQ